MRRIVLIPAVSMVAWAALLFAGAGTAHAQSDTRALYDRIDRLERDLQLMQSQAARGGTVITSPALGGGSRPVATESAPMPAGIAARLDERVDQLEDQLRHLTGKIEEAAFKAAQAQKQLERLQADIDLRFKDLQADKAAAPAQGAQVTMPAAGGGAPAADGKVVLTPPKGADGPGPAPGPQTLGSMPDKDMKKLLPGQPAATPAPAPKDPQALYDLAYAAAQRGDYDQAESGFHDFLAKFPSHQQAGNAQYWLGDIAFNKKDYGTAAGTFLDGYKKYPKHSKAPDMIYKAGSAFGQMGKKKEACTAFSILFAEQPQMPDRVKRAAQAEKQRYECK